MLGRPHRVPLLLASLDEATPADAYRVLFLVSPEDTTVIEAVDNAGAERLVVPRKTLYGDYARKINAGYAATAEDYLFLGADDLHFHPGWFERAVSRFDNDPAIGVVGTNDLGNSRVMRGDHATHSLVARRYADEFGTIDEPGKVLHEGYWHEYVDDELVGTAKARNAWAFAEDSHVEHLHPQYGKAAMDDSYEQQHYRMSRTSSYFRERRRLWT